MNFLLEKTLWSFEFFFAKNTHFSTDKTSLTTDNLKQKIQEDQVWSSCIKKLQLQSSLTTPQESTEFANHLHQSPKALNLLNAKF